MTRQHWLLGAAIMILALLTFTGSNQDQPTHAHTDNPESTLTVSGRGEIAAAPDTGQIEIGVQIQQRTAEQAISANARQMGTVVDALMGLGIDPRDIQTSRFSVSPVYERPDRQESVLVGFRAENRVRIIVRDVKSMGRIIDTAADAGANQIHSINFLVSDREDLEEQALRLAIADARRKAEVAADESGVCIVGIRKIDISGDAVTVPMVRAEAADAVETPVMPGQVDIRVRVSMTFDLSR